MDKFKELKELIATAEADSSAFFDKSNKAAGTRLRNAMQQTNIAQHGVKPQTF